MMTHFNKSIVLLAAISASVLLTACGDAKTIIREKASIPIDDGHNHGGGAPGGSASGRLLIINTEDTAAEVYDLSDNKRLATAMFDGLSAVAGKNPPQTSS